MPTVDVVKGSIGVYGFVDAGERIELDLEVLGTAETAVQTENGHTGNDF